MSVNKEILQLTKKLIGFKTDPTNFDELKKSINLVEKTLSEFTIERFNCNGYSSILIQNRAKNNKNFHLILNGHLDVIPSPQKKYKSKIIGNKLYGVGSMDMKANVATMIYVFKEIAKSICFPLALQIVTDEEIGGFFGTKHQISNGIKSDFVIAGESTNFNIVNKTKGILWVNIKCRGVSAHGAYPWLGDNAVLKAKSIVEKLYKLYPIPKSKEKNIWITSVNLSNIESNNKSFNKIPSEATISLDIRYIPEEKEQVIKNLRSIIGKDGEIEIVVNEPFLNVKDNNKFITNLQKASYKVLGTEVKLYGAMGSSDARHYTDIGTPAIEFGPVGGNIGSEEEWVGLDSLQDFYNILKEFILDLNHKYSK